MPPELRALSEAEVGRLEKQGCRCEDWSRVKVSQGFDTARVRKTTFSGDVQLGELTGSIRFYGGLMKPAGITDATIHNCVIGNNVYISNVTNHIANYVIEDDCIIDHIDLLAVDGTSSFGNDAEAEVINEGGGRQVPIYDHLNAQTAYIIALYRHRPEVVKKLGEMIAEYAGQASSSTGLIGRGAQLINCGTLKNVRVGPAAVIGNAKRLENGTVNSCQEDPAELGANVIAKNFIVCSGAKISDNCVISDCFIGQATRLSKQYSAENSVFFANCGCYHGEACAIFAGPYTVTHHKATLLIAGMFSFFNAGSASNQSNHMYKVGPVHQGICERGTKTASDSYLLYPARIGAFSVVMGRHYVHPNTSDIPFSYLCENEGHSYVVPGVNLRTVGTVRDADKWPRRDKRKDPNRLDLIIFDALNPYTVQKIINGRELLENLRPAEASVSNVVVCNNLYFNTGSLEKGIGYYELGLSKYLGDKLVARLKAGEPETVGQLRAILKPRKKIGRSKWVDMAGLIVPEEYLEGVLGDIETGGISSLQELNDRLHGFYKEYAEYEWVWVADKLAERWGCGVEEASVEQVVEMIGQWSAATEKLNKLILEDAEKEFKDISMIGYGIDGDEQIRKSDFESVRGSYETNSFVGEVRTATVDLKRSAKELAGKISGLR